MTDQPTTDPTHGLSVQHADALWDAVAIPGPTEPTFPMQHERVCRAVAEILDELTPASPVVPVSSPPPDQTALRDRIAEAVWERCNVEGISPRLIVDDPRNLADAVLAVLPPPTTRAAVYREVADRLTTDAHGMQPDWARIYKRDAAVKVREWAEQLDGEGRHAEPSDGIAVSRTHSEP